MCVSFHSPKTTATFRRLSYKTMVYTVTLNPARDRTLTINNFRPGAVNRISAVRDDPGGKGVNVSKIIASLKEKSVATGILGGDAGKYIRKSLTEMGIENDFVFTQSETRTNIKIIDSSRHETTDINLRGEPVSKRVLSSVLAKLMSRVQSSDVVVLAGGLPDATPENLLADWTLKLKSLGAKVFIDADSKALSEGVKASPYLIKPNEPELRMLTGEPFSTLKDIHNCAKRVIDATGISVVCVSMGDDGAFFVTEGAAYRGEALRVPVVCSTGAGDAMMAALAIGIHDSMPFIDTCRLAIAVSAASVSCAGTQCPKKETVEALYSRARVERYI